MFRNQRAWLAFVLLWVGLLPLISACAPERKPFTLATAVPPTPRPTSIIIDPFPTRPIYTAGQLVEYTAQTGDTLTALAARFNSTEREIRQANPILPQEVTTLPTGLPMKIPIYYQPFWSNPARILHDSLFINGPAQKGFDIVAFVQSKPGWLKDYEFFTGERSQKGGELINLIATDYSLSPRLLLALVEYQTGALTQPSLPLDLEQTYPLGYKNASYKGLYRQLLWAANLLNHGFYSWRQGRLPQWDLLDGRLERPDPWQNAASIALQYYFSRILQPADYQSAISDLGLGKTYRTLFGDPLIAEPHIPGSLAQPALRLPFKPGAPWAYTGGPHTAYGDGEPFGAIDFAPPAVAGGCQPTNEWATALADGVIARTGNAIALLDLDGDGDERTGWVIFYLHLAADGMVQSGQRLKTGDPLGHPSCEGGRATGTHVHIARKYNGEWIPADGALAFNLEGWIAQRGTQPYEGYLVRAGKTIRACTCSDQNSHIQSGQ